MDRLVSRSKRALANSMRLVQERVIGGIGDSQAGFDGAEWASIIRIYDLRMTVFEQRYAEETEADWEWQGRTQFQRQVNCVEVLLDQRPIAFEPDWWHKHRRLWLLPKACCISGFGCRALRPDCS
jgi:hypothetical protein